MAVPDMSIPASGNPGLYNAGQQNTFQNLGSVLNLAQGYTELQMQQQKQQELSAAADFVKNSIDNPEYKNPDGSLNNQKFATDLLIKAPVYGGTVLANAQVGAENGLKLNALARDINAQDRDMVVKQFAQIFQYPAINKTDPASITPQEKLEAMQGWERINNNLDKIASGDPQLQNALRIVRQGFGFAVADTDDQRLMKQGIGAGHVITKLDPENGLQTIKDYAGGLYPMAAQAGAPNLPPRAPFGGAQQPLSAPQAQPAAPGMGSSAFRTDRDGTALTGTKLLNAARGQMNEPEVRASVDLATNQVNALRDADGATGTGYLANKDLAQQIMALSKELPLQAGPPALNQMANKLGYTSANELLSDLNRRSQAAMEQLGIRGTNAGAEQAAKIAGDLSMSPKAIRYDTALFNALNELQHKKVQGLDAVSPPGELTHPGSWNMYRRAWSEYGDPLTQMADEASGGKDPETMAELKKTLTEQQWRDMRRKINGIETLRNGNLPQ